MDLRQLRYFVSIVEERSFSKAAASLRVAQPALSQHVRNMEADLGAELLVRTSHGVYPTEAGDILLARARKLLEEFADIRTTISQQHSNPAGEVRLGLPGTIGDILSVPLILQTRTQYPDVTIKISEAMSGFVHEWLLDGRLDLGLLYLPVEERGLISEPIIDEELCLFGPSEPIAGIDQPSGSVASLEEVVGLPLILPSAHHGLRQLIDETVERDGLSVSTVIEVDSYSSMKELVKQRLGFSILPVNAIINEINAKQFTAWLIGDKPLMRTIYLVSQEKFSTKSSRVVGDLCRTIIRSRIVRMNHV